MTKPLIVYKASAGSGKTFTLSTEYIKLLVENPMRFKSILAVTFTNKATEEMKRRILSQLYGIWKGLGDSQSYTDAVCAQLDASPEFVSKQAGIALHLLLHNYGYFRVETIDAFFQSVLRNMARELDLTANLRIELNDNQVEALAVDKLIEGLDTTSPVLRWIMEYIYGSISDEKSWNVLGKIKRFGQQIFKDAYKEASPALVAKMQDEKFFEAFSRRLRSEKKEAKEAIDQISASFFDALSGEGLSVDDLSYKAGGPASFFLKLRAGDCSEGIVSKRALAAADDPGKWTSKSSPYRAAIRTLGQEQLTPLLRYALDARPALWKKYASASITLTHLDQLRLLGSIERKVRELNEGANRFLLTDTQQLLHALISESDSPFIFEKIGTQLEHVMIDEFQDTSTVQWKNFKVLLQECMSHAGTENLIVGDVKQSIYRWRAGDWRMLNNITAEFANPAAQVDVRTLSTNYRSKRGIIDFNNAIFTEAVKMEAEALGDERLAAQVKAAYADVCQQVPPSKGQEGCACVLLLPKENYKEAVLDAVCQTVQRLTGEGVRQGHIAILVRANNFIPTLARRITDTLEGVSVVSDEAFRLDASVAVNVIILAMKLLVLPQDRIARATLGKMYQTEVLGHDTPDNSLLTEPNSLDELLPEAFTLHADELARQPLYELAQKLYEVFSLSRLQSQGAYLCAFYDAVSEFTEDNFAGIDTFIEEWDARLCAKTIPADEADGIRIISIHKSKGLEFDNVIIPYCDWQMEHTDTMWCKASEAPYDELPLIPVDFSKNAMAGTVYDEAYQTEHFQNVVDNLNLLYVAFTRAAHNLFVVSKKKAGASTRGLTLEACLPLLAKSLPGATLEGEEDGTAPTTFVYGELFVPREQTQRTASANVFLAPERTFEMGIESFEGKTEFRQSNQSRDFIGGEEDEEGAERTAYIRTGSLLHSIFSTIRTKDDIARALKELEGEGIIYDDTLTAAHLSEMLRRRLADPRVADWFSGRWTLFNECTILTRNPSTGKPTERRPDRVMTDGKQTVVVDFKFGKPKPEHHSQVRQYMHLLQAMGHAQVKGYLWFVYSNKIEEVKQEP